MEKKIVNELIKILEAHKAENITVLNVSNLTCITNYMIICEGRSLRHIKALADEIIKSDNVTLMNSSNHKRQDINEWMVVDCNQAIVHIMHHNAREHYQLEKLWEPI